MSESVSKRLRQAVERRARGRCEYCLSPLAFATESFAVEHIISAVRGGETVQENLALSCSGCNGHKYDKIEALDPENQHLVPLYHPRQDQWRDHFAWDEEYTHLIGLTPTGRATIVALHLNRVGIVNLRWALFCSACIPRKKRKTNNSRFSGRAFS